MLDIKKLLTKILSYFDAPFKTVSNTSSAVSINQGNTQIMDVPITIPQGYAFLAVRGVGVNYGEIYISKFIWDAVNSKVVVTIRSTYSGTLSATVLADVVCYKLGGVVKQLLSVLTSGRGWAMC